MLKTIPDNLFPPLSMAVGQLILSWSFVEVSLDQWVAVVYQGVGGKQIEREIPRGLDRKIKFLRRCFKRIPALEPFAEEATDILSRAKKLSSIRHTIVHGFVSKYDPHTQTMTFVKLDARKDRDIHRVNETPLTFAQLLDAGGECLNLSTDSARLAKRLAERFSRQRPNIDHR